MCRWLCCTCQVEESYPSHENERLKSPKNYPYGHHKKVLAPVKPEVQKASPPIEVHALPLDELKEKTNNFGSKALISEGSYERVYHANLENGKAVAVKKLDVPSELESNVEFFTQVSVVSRLKHENLVELLGYCVEGNLKGVQGAQPNPVLDWMTRVRIAVDAARGLKYLHEKVQPLIIHRDIKSSHAFSSKISKQRLLILTF